MTGFKETAESVDNVTVEVLGKICVALNCTLDDIVEFIPDEAEEGKNHNG